MVPKFLPLNSLLWTIPPSSWSNDPIAQAGLSRVLFFFLNFIFGCAGSLLLPEGFL